MDSFSSPNRFASTPAELESLRRKDGEPLHVPTLDDECIRQGLAHAAAQVNQGEVADWSKEEILTAGRELLARQGKLS